MEIFIDDPNNDVDASERSFAKRLHLLGLIGSIIPPLNLFLPFLLSKSNKKPSSFITKHISGVLNFQLLIVIMLVLGIGLFLIVSFFYVLLYAFLVILLQALTTYNYYSAAKNGTIYKFPISINVF